MCVCVVRVCDGCDGTGTGTGVTGVCVVRVCDGCDGTGTGTGVTVTGVTGVTGRGRGRGRGRGPGSPPTRQNGPDFLTVNPSQPSRTLILVVRTQ